MKNVVSGLMFLSLIGSVNAEPFTVGGTVLEVPAPKGFTLVTPHMDAVYRLSLQMADPVNDQLAFYISESDIPAAMKRGIPPLARYYTLKANKKLEFLVVGSNDFVELKSITKKRNEQILASLEEKMPAIIDNISKGIGEELDVDFALKLSQTVPLDPHYETDNALAYSMYVKYGVTVEGQEKDLIVSATVTFVNVAGKVLFLYCYGPQEDLEWTRIASKDWAEMIMKSNALPPSRSPGYGNFDWSRFIERGIVGAITGGFIAVIFGIFFGRNKNG
jgi:hypothetical protein